MSDTPAGDAAAPSPASVAALGLQVAELDPASRRRLGLDAGKDQDRGVAIVGVEGREAREARLAKALRDNLRRRKAPAPPPDAADEPKD